MAVLWCGGEDIDFNNGATPSVNTTGGKFRSAWSRCSINMPTSGNVITSNQFSGGAVTSAWLAYTATYSSGSGLSNRAFGVGLFGTNKGLFLGNDSTTAGKFAIYKYDGTTSTKLATETGTSILGATTTVRIDFQIISYGASATLNIYQNGLFIMTFSGDVTVTAMTNFDCVAIGNNAGGSAAFTISEVIVATDDTRPWQGLMTLALTGAGTTTNWTNNTFSNINGTSFSDTNPTSDNVNGDIQEYNVTDLVSGTFTVVAVKQTMRAAKSATPAVTQIDMGYRNGSTVAYGTGALKAVTTVYAQYEQLDLTDPTTTNPWLAADMNALQLAAKAVT